MHSGQSGDYRGMPPAGIAVLALPADAFLAHAIARALGYACGIRGHAHAHPPGAPA
jgi:hypothetical protein